MAVAVPSKLAVLLKRIATSRYAQLWIATFAVVFFSLFVWVGHSARDKDGTAWKWTDMMPGGGTAVVPDSAAYEALTHVADPLTEAKDGVWGNYKWYSDSRLRALTACMARGDCPPNADKVLIINVWHCHNALFKDYHGGEGVWCNAMRNSLEKQGYTVLYTYDDWEYVKHIYRQIPDLVKIIIADDDHLNSRAKSHYKTKENPHGIPAWKFFRFNYYQTDTATIVGDAWVITCEPEWRELGHDYRNFTYLGYAMEPDLAHTKYIPFNERPYRAYVLGKHMTFFYDVRGARVAWKHDFYARATKQLREKYPDFEFVGSFFDERGDEDKEKEGPLSLPEGIRNLPHLGPEEFDHELMQARMLVGIGWPTASPSPYRGLARGLPFLSPFAVGYGGSASDPYSWSDSQHDSLRLQKPPYVYNVEENNYEDFVNAIMTAMETPIEPYVYPRMEAKAFDERMRKWMDTDWRAEAARILEARLAGHETQKTHFVEVFEL